jgi:hypothetical protein
VVLPPVVKKILINRILYFLIYINFLNVGIVEVMNFINIQGVPGGMCQTSGGCSLS